MTISPQPSHLSSLPPHYQPPTLSLLPPYRPLRPPTNLILQSTPKLGLPSLPPLRRRPVIACLSVDGGDKGNGNDSEKLRKTLLKDLYERKEDRLGLAVVNSVALSFLKLAVGVVLTVVVVDLLNAEARVVVSDWVDKCEKVKEVEELMKSIFVWGGLFTIGWKKLVEEDGATSVKTDVALFSPLPETPTLLAVYREFLNESRCNTAFLTDADLEPQLKNLAGWKKEELEARLQTLSEAHSTLLAAVSTWSSLQRSPPKSSEHRLVFFGWLGFLVCCLDWPAFCVVFFVSCLAYKFYRKDPGHFWV